MKFSVIVSVGIFCVLCQAIELNPFAFGRKSKKGKTNDQVNNLEERQKWPVVAIYLIPKRHTNDLINRLESNSQLLTSDFDVSPVERSISDTSLLRYDPISFNVNDLFQFPNQLTSEYDVYPVTKYFSSVTQLEPSISDAHLMFQNPFDFNDLFPLLNQFEEFDAPPDQTDVKLPNIETQTESASKSNVPKSKPSGQTPELQSSIQTGADYANQLQDYDPTRNALILLTEFIGKIVFGVPLFLGYLKFVIYLKELCSTTCYDVTVTSTATSTANSLSTLTALSNVTARYTTTLTFITLESTTTTKVTTTTSTTETTTMVNPGGRFYINPIDSLWDDESNEESFGLTWVFSNTEVEATLLPHVYATHEALHQHQLE